MTKVLAVTNHKGGVGKTHSVFHLAGAFAESGKRVLAIDLDPQGNLTGLFLQGNVTHTLYDVLVEDVSINDAIHKTAFEGIEVVAADKRLQQVDALLQDEPDAQIRLADALQELPENRFDYALLDCPPNIGLTTRNALAAAQRVIVPVEADKFSVDGLDSLVQLVRTMQRAVNPKLKIAGILVSLFNSRRSIEQLYAEALETKGLRMFETRIKDAAAYREAITNHKPITHYKKRSEYAEAFRSLRDELEHTHASSR